MAEVRRLPDHLVNLIAAGEVVERPASVVKELLENSLDAGAGKIEIELEAGGRKLISLRDDGAGMGRHDLLLAVERHATSKISSPVDLDSIATLGFRGEALPSIASVSRMTILTSCGGDGWKLVMTGGVIDTLEPAGRTRGTTVTVENLFFNQPARRKFLRAETTELAWIERIVTASSLSALETGILLLHGGRAIFDLKPVESAAERLRQRYELPAAERLVEAVGRSGSVSVSLTVFPERRWASRKHQFVLVNGRPVHAPSVYTPLRESLSGPAGEPLLLCSVSVPLNMVDVNAHPAKNEVRFRKPFEVQSAVRSATASLALNRRDSLLTAFREPSRSMYGGGSHAPGRLFPASPVSASASGTAMMFQNTGPAEETAEEAVRPDWKNTVEISVLFDSYLMSETSTGLLIVDQHAAHERILYERILASMRGAMSAGRQQVLIPEEIPLDREEEAVLQVYGPLVRQAGYDFRVESGTLFLLSLPSGVRRGAETIREIISSLSEGGGGASSTEVERIAAASACKGSIRFGDKISQAEAQNLFHTLFTTEDPFHCPHGRPTLIELPFTELERRFGR